MTSLCQHLYAQSPCLFVFHTFRHLFILIIFIIGPVNTCVYSFWQFDHQLSFIMWSYGDFEVYYSQFAPHTLVIMMLKAKWTIYKAWLQSFMYRQLLDQLCARGHKAGPVLAHHPPSLQTYTCHNQVHVSYGYFIILCFTVSFSNVADIINDLSNEQNIIFILSLMCCLHNGQIEILINTISINMYRTR